MTMGNLFQKLEGENPQDILDSLPPLPDTEEEPELTPELKEGIFLILLVPNIFRPNLNLT